MLKKLEKLEKMNKNFKRKYKTLELKLQTSLVQNLLQNIQTQLLKKEIMDCEDLKHLSSFKKKYAETLIPLSSLKKKKSHLYKNTINTSSRYKNLFEG